jgi:hypothetical protein
MNAEAHGLLILGAAILAGIALGFVLWRVLVIFSQLARMM